MAVVSATVRQGTYSAIRTLLVANKPTYTPTGGTLQTYSIVAEYPKDNPSFPLIVLNSPLVDPTLITMDGSGNEQPIDVQLDLYTKEAHGMKAIDAGMDSIQATILDNQATLKDTDKLVLMEDAFDESNPSNFEENNQQINTKSVIIKMKLA